MLRRALLALLVAAVPSIARAQRAPRRSAAQIVAAAPPEVRRLLGGRGEVVRSNNPLVGELRFVLLFDRAGHHVELLAIHPQTQRRGRY